MKRLQHAAIAVSIFIVSALPSLQAAASSKNSISGSLSNAATRDLLVGAKVELPESGLSALTDETGRFVINDVPDGTHKIVASYTGLDPVTRTVTVSSGQRAVSDFDLTTSVYQLATFVVSGEREGMAAAITAQRNADNVKNVVSMDFYGNLPNMNASELAARLPGVAGNPGDEVMEGLTIRGAGPGFNTITVDGGLLSSFGASQGLTRMQTFTGSMFDSLELIKGHTPDAGADSLGGTVNLKSRSPLSMKEKRRVTYNMNVRFVPNFTKQEPMREAHRAHPMFDANYTEVFSVLGGDRNLGVSVNLFYSENVFGNWQTSRDIQNTTTSPAYIWDFRTRDNFNNRKQASVNFKTEYRLSPDSKFTFNTIYNDHTEPLRRIYTTRAFTNQTVGTTGTAGILPGYTDTFEQVRASTGSNIDIGGQMLERRLRNRQFDFGGEHHRGPFDLDYHAIYGTTQYHDGPGEANLSMRISNVGWTLDRTRSDLLPRFLQTEGLDFTNPANYSPAANGLTSNAGEADDNQLKEARANLRYKLPVKFPLFLKAGGIWRQTSFQQDFTHRRRWNYIGTSPLPADPTLFFYNQKYDTGAVLPRWQTPAFIHDGRPTNPSLWKEDLYFTQQQKVGGYKDGVQTITADYIMIRGKLAGTGFLAGVRTERTEMEGRAHVQSSPANRSTAAEQLADPVAAALKDWNNPRDIVGDYTKSFPSVHVYRDLIPNLKARLSWSTSFARPAPQTAFPAETVDIANQKLTVSNPGLRPEMAATWDASLDYYFEPVGNLSVGWFHKTIKDYFGPAINVGTVGTGTDNGYNGQYGGYSLFTTSNLGTAFVQGWEFSYQQQLTSLPGLLRGLSVSANYTLLDTHGDFGGTSVRTSGAVAGFIPKTGNLSLSWRHRAFSARVLYNYTGAYLTSYGGTSPGRNLYFDVREITNLQFSYRVRQNLTVSLNVDNILNEPQRFYRFMPAWMATTTITGVSFTAGVSGQF